MGRTNIVLDDKLMKKAMKLSDAKTKRELIDQALREYVRQREQRALLELYGSGMIDPDYDYKAARAGREM